MKTKLTLVFCAVATVSSLFADVGTTTSTLTTLSGKAYRGVRIAEVTPDGIFFRHAGGAGKILFADLPSEVRESLGFDAKKAEAYRKEMSDRQAKERLALIEREKELAKAQASAADASAAQAYAAAAQLVLAAKQTTSGGDAWGWNANNPIVWTTGGWGWYDERIPSPSYGGGAYYKVRRWVRQPASYQMPFRAGQVASTVPYSPNHVGHAPFANGVPALGSSFMNGLVHRPGVTGTSGGRIGCATPVLHSGHSR